MVRNKNTPVRKCEEKSQDPNKGFAIEDGLQLQKCFAPHTSALGPAAVGHCFTQHLRLELTPKALGGNLLMSRWFAAGRALKRIANCIFIMAHTVLERNS